MSKQGENMGFLTAYEGFRKIFIDEKRGYWVELREFISQGAKEEAERTLSKVVMQHGEAVPVPDVARYRQLMLVAAIKDWNLDDDSGHVWPVDLRHVQKLPGTVFDDLWKEVDAGNKERTSEEERQFPAEDLGGGEDGFGRAPEFLDLPA